MPGPNSLYNLTPVAEVCHWSFIKQLFCKVRVPCDLRRSVADEQPSLCVIHSNRFPPFYVCFLVNDVALCFVVIQGDHLSGKPGNVRVFDNCQGSLMEKILSGSLFGTTPV